MNGEPADRPYLYRGGRTGDALVVILNKVRLNRNWGWTSYRLGLFSLMPEYAERIYPNHYKKDLVQPGRDNLVPWDIDLVKNTVRLREPSSHASKLEFPAQPMLGCIWWRRRGRIRPTVRGAGFTAATWITTASGKTLRYGSRLSSRRDAVSR